MAREKSGPLGPEHLKLLNKLIQACAETEAYCAKCESCDLDVTPERKKNSEQLRIAQKIKATFFPGEK